MIAGRVALINYGPNEGKLVTIVDVVDGNRVGCPALGMPPCCGAPPSPLCAAGLGGGTLGAPAGRQRLHFISHAC